MKLDQWQQDFLNTKGDKVLCCGRQVGKSTICAEDAGKWALNNPGQNVLVIAPLERQAYSLFEKILNYLVTTNPKAICKGKDRPTQTRVKLVNKTAIWCLPVGLTGLGVRFMTIGRLYADEASRIPDEVWTAVTPLLLITGGDSIYLSTPAGDTGYFADVVNNKGGVFGSFTRFFKSSEEVIKERELSESWTTEHRERALRRLEQEKSRMTALQYAQEYEGKIVEALKQYFPTELIKSCMTLKRGSPSSSGDLFMGVDVAGMGEDKSVLISVERTKEKHQQIYQRDMVVMSKTRITDVVEAIKKNDLEHRHKRIYIDDGGMGVGVFDTLLVDGQTRRKVVAINNNRRAYDNEDKKKKLLKEDLYNNLLALMEQRKVSLFDEPEILYSMVSIRSELVNGRMKIWGSDSHIAEALIRAVWCMKDKGLNIWVDFS